SKVLVSIPGLSERKSAGILFISPVLDPVSRAFAVQVSIPQEIMFPGEGGALTVSIVTDISSRLTVPILSLDESGGLQYVYEFDGLDPFNKKQFSTGIRDFEWVEITAGTELNRRVVVNGWSLIKAELEKGTGLPPGAHVHADG